jgi:hypothetical protein
VESPTDFNECVSKAELTKLVANQRAYMQGQFDALTQHINGLVTPIEHVEQRPPLVQPEDDDEFEDVNPDEERL